KVAEAVDTLGAAAPGCVSVERVSAPVGRRWTPPVPEAVDLEAGRFDRPLDRAWRRTSYTGIIAAAHEARVASEPEAASTTDEPDIAVAPRPAAVDDDATLRAVPSRWAALPGGADVGTFVHRILER